MGRRAEVELDGARQPEDVIPPVRPGVAFGQSIGERDQAELQGGASIVSTAQQYEREA